MTYKPFIKALLESGTKSYCAITHLAPKVCKWPSILIVLSVSDSLQPSFHDKTEWSSSRQQKTESKRLFRPFTFIIWFDFLCGVFARAGFSRVRTLSPQQQTRQLEARPPARCHQTEHTAVTTHLNRRWRGGNRKKGGWRSKRGRRNLISIPLYGFIKL